MARAGTYVLPITDEEKAVLKAKAETVGVTLSDYIREKLGLPPMLRGQNAHAKDLPVPLEDLMQKHVFFRPLTRYTLADGRVVERDYEWWLVDDSDPRNVIFETTTHHRAVIPRDAIDRFRTSNQAGIEGYIYLKGGIRVNGDRCRFYDT